MTHEGDEYTKVTYSTQRAAAQTSSWLVCLCVEAVIKHNSAKRPNTTRRPLDYSFLYYEL